MQLGSTNYVKHVLIFLTELENLRIHRPDLYAVMRNNPSEYLDEVCPHSTDVLYSALNLSSFRLDSLFLLYSAQA